MYILTAKFCEIKNTAVAEIILATNEIKYIVGCTFTFLAENTTIEYVPPIIATVDAILPIAKR